MHTLMTCSLIRPLRVLLITLSLCWSIHPLRVHAQEQLTLQQAITLCLENNFAIKIGKNAVDIATANNTVGNAGMLPNVTLNATYSGASNNIRQVFLRDNSSQELTGAHSDQLNSNIQLTWTLFDGLAMFSAKDRLEKIQAQSSTALQNAVELSVANIIQSYSTILQQQYLLASQRDALAISRERLRLAETKVGIGAASNLDVLQARNDMNADSAAVLRQHIIIANAKNQLNVLIGRPATIEFTLSDSLTMPTTRFFFNDIRSRIEQQSTALQIARMAIEIAENDIAIARAQHLPDINLIGTFGFNRGQQNFGLVGLNQNQFSSIGLQLSLPLFAGMNISRQVEVAQLQRRANELNLAQIKLQTEAQVATLLRDYDNNIQLAQFESEGLSTARLNAKIAFEKYKLGGLSALEFRDVQRTLFFAENRYFTALLNARISETEILRLSGQLLK